MDYSALSDFEVNKLVSAHLWGSVCSVDGVVLHNDKDGAFDPCTNPADAWPIIVESGIGIAPSRKDPHAWDLSGGMLRGIKHSDANPLRAAMVVFLMMQEAGVD